MSKLGNIYLSYGKQFNIAVANTYSDIVLSGSNLPSNTIIISSPLDDEENDAGSYSLLITDSYGTPIRLSYNIKSGNGLTIDGDTLYLSIDNENIKSSDNNIYIDLQSLGNNFINTTNNILSVNNDSIDRISDSVRGVCTVDDRSIKIDEGTIYINTDNLQYSDNSTSQYGIVVSSTNSFRIDNGVISLNQDNLPKSSNSTYGVCKANSNEVDIDSDSILSINTSNLEKASKDLFGIIKNDNNKILSNNGVLSVNTSNLNAATSDRVGIISIDNNTIKLNSNGQITVSEYDTIKQDLDNLYSYISTDLEELNSIKENLLSQIK